MAQPHYSTHRFVWGCCIVLSRARVRVCVCVCVCTGTDEWQRAESPRANFDTLLNAFTTVFQVPLLLLLSMMLLLLLLL